MPAVKVKKVRGNTSPPAGAKPTGETVQWGDENLVVYREPKPWTEISEVVPLMVNGREQWHTGPNGEQKKLKTQRVERKNLSEADRHYEYIIVDRGNGITYKHFNFRSGPEELAAREAEAKRARFEDELYEAMSEAGMDIKDFVKRVVGGKAKA